MNVCRRRSWTKNFGLPYSAWFQPATLPAMERAQPIYEELPGWGQDVTHVRHLGDLPTEARQYVRRIEQILGVQVDMISVGPERDQAIVTRDVFGATIDP